MQQVKLRQIQRTDLDWLVCGAAQQKPSQVDAIEGLILTSSLPSRQAGRAW